MSDHEELESNVAAWVLGALDREEAEVVQAHVEGCASCRESLAGAKATVIDLKGDGLALVDFSGLPAVGQGRVYEVWLITSGGRADPAAVFVPDGNGSKVVLVNRALQGYSLMAITNEAGPDGQQAPPQEPQLYGTAP